MSHTESEPAQASSHRHSSPAALITSFAALITALGGLYVAVREPTATKVSDASEAMSQATLADHDELVKLIQAVDDLSKNSDQNHDSLDALRTYLDTQLAEMQRVVYTAPAARPAQPTAAPAAPAVQPLKKVAIPTATPKPPHWNAKVQELQH